METQKDLMNNKSTMQLGMVGLGRMGANMARRLLKEGHQCVVYDRAQQAVKGVAKENAVGADALADLVRRSRARRAGKNWAVPPSAAISIAARMEQAILLKWSTTASNMA